MFFSSRRRHTIYWRDWSSDVCSSDLAPLDCVFGVGGEFGLNLGLHRLGQQLVGIQAPPGGQIGRASCRERVQIPVVAVSLQKRNSQRLQHQVLEEELAPTIINASCRY